MKDKYFKANTTKEYNNLETDILVEYKDFEIDVKIYKLYEVQMFWNWCQSGQVEYKYFVIDIMVEYRYFEMAIMMEDKSFQIDFILGQKSSSKWCWTSYCN